MASTKQLKEENEQWHREHVHWVAEVAQWQRETQRLVAWLYKLDKALPEQTALLKQHLALIEQHEQKIMQYQCGLDPRCLPECPDFISIERQLEFHKTLNKLHNETSVQHLNLKQGYLTKLENFKALVKDILNEID